MRISLACLQVNKIALLSYLMSSANLLVSAVKKVLQIVKLPLTRVSSSNMRCDHPDISAATQASEERPIGLAEKVDALKATSLWEDVPLPQQPQSKLPPLPQKGSNASCFAPTPSKERCLLWDCQEGKRLPLLDTTAASMAADSLLHRQHHCQTALLKACKLVNLRKSYNMDIPLG